MKRRDPRHYSNPCYKILVKGGKWVDISLVLLVYRCEECHAGLKRRDAGVVCSENPNHKHVIHRDEVAKIQATELDDLAAAQMDYAIKDGQLVYTGEFKA